jgi:hypothetical protein
MNLEVVHIEENPSYFFTFQDKHAIWKTNVVYITKVKNLDFTPSDECVAIKFFNTQEVLTDAEHILPNVLEFVKVFKA